MNWRKPQLWIALFSGLAVVTVALVDSGRTAPGPLAQVHGREQSLAGKRDCAECHGSWRESMASACMQCHVDIEEQLEADLGLHGSLLSETVQECALCHSDHHGANFAMVTRQSFALAGVPDPDQFDHERIGFLLDGAHLELDCLQCHTHSADAVLAPGGRRFMGLERYCGSCHADPHEGRMQPTCSACHGQADFALLRSEGHDRQLPLIGGHADLDCRTCHAAETSHALEDMGPNRAVAARTCQDCHESPHVNALVDGTGRSAGLTAGQSCVVCHQAEHTEFQGDLVTVTPDQHAAVGFALDAPHDTATCADCHAPELGAFAERYPGRDEDTCSACHEDPHGGQFDKSPFFADDCLGCHARGHFEPPEFDVERHATAALRLEGTHAQTACNDCHEAEHPDLPRTFRGTPTRCDACHDDVHAGLFTRREPTLDRAPQGSCASCHLATTFADSAQASFDHARWTGFGLQGAHLQGACEACHERAHEPDAAGRSFGRVGDQFGKVEGCASCHQDPHAGQFDRAASPREVDGRQGCARCHSEVSFRSVTDSFEHRRWTGFALRGAHKPLECTACHTPRATPDEHGRSWGQAAGSACNDCHADPHGGQFRVADSIDCARCHSTNSSFEELTFDHEDGARFPLGEAHANVSCAACHPKSVQSDGVERVRYRPLKMECADCHGVQERPLLRRGGKDK